MVTAIGIRREDKNPWERRVPLVPSQVARLIEEHRLTVYVQPSDQRIFPDEEYRKAGAKVQENLSSCQAILGVKEMPLAFFERGKTYLFFSHTIKGQPYNMPMLRRMMELQCQLIDYERIIDEKNRRLVLFGRHAGLAGMIETLRALGERLSLEGVSDSQNPFSKIKPAYRYENLAEAKTHLRVISREIEEKDLPRSIVPMVIGFLGYGNVSQGAQEILDCFKVEEIRPEDLFSLDRQPRPNGKIYKVIFQEKDTVEPVDASIPFSLSDYFDHPGRFRATFSRYLPFLTAVVNGIYWDKNFPVLIQTEDVRKLYGESQRPALRVIGDITCDIQGSIAITRKSTLPDQPCYGYDTVKDRIVDGINDLNGPVIMAVDNLPTEFPVESSTDFGNALFPFIPSIVHTDFILGLDESPLPDAIKRAVILVQGRLTESYRYLERFLRSRVEGKGSFQEREQS